MMSHIQPTNEGLTIIRKSTKAAFFDFDGTIMDNTALQGQAWLELAHEYNIPLTMEEFGAQFTGKTSKAIIKELFKSPHGMLTESETDKLYRQRLSIYQEIAQMNAREIPGFSALFTALGNAGIMRALVTSGSKPTRDFQLGLFPGLEERFDVIIGQEDVANTKPHHEPYELGLQKLRAKYRSLGIQAVNCIAVEDSPTGVQSATAANIPTIGILSGHTEEELRAAGAIATVRDYRAITLTA